MEIAIGRLRTQANRLDIASEMVRTGLFHADLTSDVHRRLDERADRFRRVADELSVRVDIVMTFQIDPGSIDSALVATAMNAGLESVDTLAELNHQIDTWNGTDNDPLLDDLVRRRNQLLSSQFGDSTIDPFIAQVADTNDLTYEQAELAVLSVEVENLTAEMDLLAGPGMDTDRWNELNSQRSEALDRLLTNDADLVAEVGYKLNRGTELFTAISDSVQAVYGDSSILDLQAAMEAHSVEGSFGLALFDLNDLHTAAVERFTGVDAELVNPFIAGHAQADDVAYNAIIEQLNADIQAGEREGDPFDLIPINGTIPNDATLLWNLSQQELFQELETALQGDRSDYDGKMSLDDLESIIENPGNFSTGAVAAATMLARDFELRRRIDVAGSHQFLDGLATGTHSIEGTDGIISQADVRQHVTNSVIFELLEPHASDLDLDNDDRITKAEFDAQLAAIDPDGNIAAAINYALSDGAFDDRDRRSNMEKVGDGLFTFGRLTTGIGGLDLIVVAAPISWQSAD